MTTEQTPCMHPLHIRQIELYQRLVNWYDDHGQHQDADAVRQRIVAIAKEYVER